MTEATHHADEELRPLVIAAVRLNVPYRRIRDLTGLSLDTISAWARSGEPR